MNEVSFLLGAGFSVNKGYPTARQLNNKIVSLKEQEFSVATDGTLFFLNEGGQTFPEYGSWLLYKHFLLEIIDYYQSKVSDFHYEAFYDYYHEMFRSQKYTPEFDTFCEGFRKKYKCKDSNHNLLSNLNTLFNQLISWFLVDSEGNRYYKSTSFLKPTYPGYTGILNVLESYGKDNTVHIHTLNHDLFFESLGGSQWINGELSDGFEELGSPYYGTTNEGYKVRLSYFANNFNSKYRLYKLHGSVDQYPFHIQGQGIDNYIKIKYGAANNLLKEIKHSNGELIYIEDWINYHSDFLSGTTSKILRYGEPKYYNEVFTHFRNNLANSKVLTLVGYGCGDLEVNNLIERFYPNAFPIYVINPYPDDQVLAFCEKFKAKLIKQGLEELTLDDFNT